MRNPIQNLLAGYQNIPHANFNFRNCERDYQKDFVQFQTYYFGFFQKHVFFVKLHFDVLEFINYWLPSIFDVVWGLLLELLIFI